MNVNMKKAQVISTRAHGILDILTAAAAIAFPRLLGCNKAFTNAVTGIAVGKLAYGMMTKHELGVVKLIPMKAHLAMDVVGGASMAALPFLMGEDEPAAIACAVGLGVMDIAAAPMTETDDYEGETPVKMMQRASGTRGGGGGGGQKRRARRVEAGTRS